MKKFIVINILLLLILCVNACGQKPVSQNDSFQEIEDTDTIYYIKDVDVKPEFVGGEKALMKFINENITFPIEFSGASAQGNVYVKFVVEKDGSITNIEIVRGVHPLFDKEAIRLVKLMPKWKPAIKGGEVVRCYFTLPVKFILRN